MVAAPYEYPEYVAVTALPEDAQVALDVFLVAHPEIDVSTHRLLQWPGMGERGWEFESPGCMGFQTHQDATCGCLMFNVVRQEWIRVTL